MTEFTAHPEKGGEMCQCRTCCYRRAIYKALGIDLEKNIKELGCIVDGMESEEAYDMAMGLATVAGDIVSSFPPKARIIVLARFMKTFTGVMNAQNEMQREEEARKEPINQPPMGHA